MLGLTPSKGGQGNFNLHSEPLKLGKQNLLLGAKKEKDGSCGAKDSSSEDFCCNLGLAGVAQASFHCCLSHKHACKMNR